MFAFGGWIWLRESPLVSVDRVTVSGLSDSHAAPVRAALESAAADMTTLNVDVAALRDAVARFPLVRDLEVTPDVPHGLHIRVIERVPVGAIESDGGTVVVAADGTILRGLPAGDLPRISSRISPGGARVSDRRTAVKVAVLAAAPRRLRARIVRVTLGPQGLIAVLTSGPRLRFGDGSRLEAKWIAAERVLRDAAARDAAYIDLRIPERPAAGGLSVTEGGTQVAADRARGRARRDDRSGHGGDPGGRRRSGRAAGRRRYRRGRDDARAAGRGGYARSQSRDGAAGRRGGRSDRRLSLTLDLDRSLARRRTLKS